MNRPDQERFDCFAQQLIVLDQPLIRSCETNLFEMEVNAYRTPSRVLRRQRRVREIVDIYLDGDWKVAEYSEQLPCSLVVCSYYETPDTSRKLYKMLRTLASESSFHSLASRIDTLLHESLSIFNKWTPEVVVEAGEEIENARRKYSDDKSS